MFVGKEMEMKKLGRIDGNKFLGMNITRDRTQKNLLSDKFPAMFWDVFQNETQDGLRPLTSRLPSQLFKTLLNNKLVSD